MQPMPESQEEEAARQQLESEAHTFVRLERQQSLLMKQQQQQPVLVVRRSLSRLGHQIKQRASCFGCCKRSAYESPH